MVVKSVVPKKIKRSKVSSGTKRYSTSHISKLPMELSSPEKDLFKYTILIYGEKKIGKTTLLSHAEGVYFLKYDPGHKALRIRGAAPKNWEETKKYISLIIKTKKIKVVIIDLADDIYSQCVDYVCRQLNISHPGDEGFGKGWSEIKDEFTKEIKRLVSSKGVVFISHSKLEGFKKRAQDEDTRKRVSSLPGQAGAILEGLVDIWAYYGYDDGKRELTIAGDDYTGAGHRCQENFKYKGTDKPIKRIDMGESSLEAYNNFIAAFNNQLILKGGSKKKKSFKVRKIKK